MYRKVWEAEHARAHQKKARKLEKSGKKVPAYVPPEPDAQIPKRFMDRSNWPTYFLAGPMAPHLHGWDCVPMLDLINGAPDVDRSAASRKRQRDNKRQHQAELLEQAKMRSKVLKKAKKVKAKLDTKAVVEDSV